MAQPSKIKVENLKELQREIRRLQDKELAKQLRQANKAAADLVRDEARTDAPELSGALARSVTTQAGQRDAAVKAGSPSRVPYAGVIHFGWPRRRIKPNPFLFGAFRKRRDEVSRTYEDLIHEVVKALES